MGHPVFSRRKEKTMGANAHHSKPIVRKYVPNLARSGISVFLEKFGKPRHANLRANRNNPLTGTKGVGPSCHWSYLHLSMLVSAENFLPSPNGIEQHWTGKITCLRPHAV